MKTFKIAVLSLFVLTFISCNNKNKDLQDDMNIEIAPEKQDAPIDELAADDYPTQDTLGLTRTQDMSDMYEELSMTEEQIDRFEEDYKKKLSMRTSDNIVDPNLIDLQMNESLKDVLTPEQFAKYEEWRKSHPRE